MGKKQSLKLQILFGSNFQFRLERCVTNVRSLFKINTGAVRKLFYQ